MQLATNHLADLDGDFAVPQCVSKFHFLHSKSIYWQQIISKNTHVNYGHDETFKAVKW